MVHSFPMVKASVHRSYGTSRVSTVNGANSATTNESWNVVGVKPAASITTPRVKLSGILFE